MALEWVRDAVRRAAGFDPYPGTLNLRLLDAGSLQRWRDARERDAQPVVPPTPGQCGGRLVAVVLSPDVPAAVIVPDVTMHADDVLEVVAGEHLRTRLGLRDGDTITLTGPASSEFPRLH